MDKQIDDQDSLIESRNQENNKLQSQILIKYIVSKLFPFFWIFFSGFFISSPSLVYFFALIFTIIDLWLCRRQYSYALVGLSWNLDMPDPQLSFEDIVSFQIEPDPFVPQTRDSNIFWLLLIGTTAYYLLLTVFSLLKLRVGAFFFLLIISFLNVFNAFLYLKCLSVSKKQSEEKAKSLMINAVHSEFLDAVPVPDDTETVNIQHTQEEKHQEDQTNKKDVDEKSTQDQKVTNDKDEDAVSQKDENNKGNDENEEESEN